MQHIPIQLNSSSYVMRESYTYNLSKQLLTILDLSDFKLNYKEDLTDTESIDDNDIFKETSIVEISSHEKSVADTIGVLKNNGNNTTTIINSQSFNVSEISYETENFITMHVRSKNRGRLEKLISSLQFRSRGGKITYLLGSEYYYYLPATVNKLLTYFSELNNLNRDKPLTPTEYLSSIDMVGFSYNALDRLENTQPARYRTIAQIATTIIGVNSLEITHNDGIYSLSFEIESQYDRVGTLSVSYNNVIHNSLLEDKYLLSPVLLNGYGDGQRTGYEDLLDTFNNVKLTRKELIDRYPYRYIHIPRVDNYIGYSIGGERILLSILTTIDDSNILVNLHELGVDKIEPILLNFLKSEHEYLTKFLESKFSIKLFTNGIQQPSSLLTIDEELNVWVNKKLDIEKIHRVVLTSIDSSDSLTRRAYNAIDKYKKKLDNTVIILNNKIVDIMDDIPRECDKEKLKGYDKYADPLAVDLINGKLENTVLTEFVIGEYNTSYVYKDIGNIVETDLYTYYLCNDDILRVYVNDKIKLIGTTDNWHISGVGGINDNGDTKDTFGGTMFSNTVNRLDLKTDDKHTETKLVQYAHIISKIIRN